MIELQEVEIDYWAIWPFWPARLDMARQEPPDKILARRWTANFRGTGGAQDIRVTTRIYPAYLAYLRAGHLKLPGHKQPGGINNLEPPPASVLVQMTRDLLELSRECQIIRWRHAYECYPTVCQEVLPRFKLAYLEFGDDCPGSSEIKTAPVAPFFRGLVHNMWVRDHATGQLTRDYYQQLGIPRASFAALGPSVGARELYVETESTPHEAPIYDVIWAGQAGNLNPERFNFLCELSKVPQTELRTAMHGPGMRDGYLRDATKGRMAIVGPLYQKSKFILNYQMSSIFNCRFWDAGYAGVPQLIWDKHGELRTFGFEPWTHYVPFNGTVKGLIESVQAAEDALDAQGRREMAACFHNKAQAMLTEHSVHNAREAMYRSLLD